MSSWARVGMKVVCVDGGIKNSGYSHNPLPIEGEVYTVSGKFNHPRDGLTLIIKERPNPCKVYGPDVGWRIERFRPLVSQEDDISMFKSLLKPTEVPA